MTMTRTKTNTRPLISEKAAKWFEAVSVRHSRRAFDGRAAAEGDLASIERVCAGFRPLPGARVELVRDPSVDIFRGIVGGYGKVTGSPHVLVMIGSDDPAAHVAAGFSGEACLLEATVRGLSTCWIGGFFDRSKAAEIVELAEDERVLAVSPLGYPRGSYTTTEHLMRGMAGAHKRKPLDVIAPTLDESWPGWTRVAIECARLAPSAVNRQPWRFSFSGRELVVSKDASPDYPSVTKELDCGIAMLHAELGALEADVRGTWTVTVGERSEIARFEPAQPQSARG